MQTAIGLVFRTYRRWPWSLATAAALLLVPVPFCTGEDGKAKDRKGNPMRCKDKDDPHGTWMGSQEIGGEYTLNCSEGYSVDGLQNVTIRCSKEGLWDADPWCENSDDCATLKHGCGPGGLCVDHVGHAECLCEEGSTKRLASNGEEVCYFHGAAKNKRCGNLSCGAHGVCVDLAEYQDTFDTGSTTFRCSCQQGYRDNGETCVPMDCGTRLDPLGTWTGETIFGGEYTLTCYTGAFVWGGSERAITVTCPQNGVWASNIRCMEREKAQKDAEVNTVRFWTNLVLSFTCICTAALAAGLTMGLVSQEKLELHILEHTHMAAGADAPGKENDPVHQLLSIKSDHHLLLVTLLLLNAFANEALPIFLDELVSAEVALLLSVTLVLLFGEILPSAVMTSEKKIDLAAPLIPLVRIFMCLFYPISKPIASLLDWVLGEEEEEMYSRAQIRAVLRMHCGQHALTLEPAAPASPILPRDGSISGSRQLLSMCEEDTPLRREESNAQDPPLHPFEGELFAQVMNIAEMKVVDCAGFLPVGGTRRRSCASTFMAAEESAYAFKVAVNAITKGMEGVVVFASHDELEDWPNSVACSSVLGVKRVVDLLAEDSKTRLKDCMDYRPCPSIDKDSMLTDALCSISDNGNADGFAIVLDNGDFWGLLDSQVAVLEMTPSPATTTKSSDSTSSGWYAKKSQRDSSQLATARTVAEAIGVPPPLPKDVASFAADGKGRRQSALPQTTLLPAFRDPERKHSAPADTGRDRKDTAPGNVGRIILTDISENSLESVSSAQVTPHSMSSTQMSPPSTNDVSQQAAELGLVHSYASAPSVFNDAASVELPVDATVTDGSGASPVTAPPETPDVSPAISELRKAVAVTTPAQVAAVPVDQAAGKSPDRVLPLVISEAGPAQGTTEEPAHTDASASAMAEAPLVSDASVVEPLQVADPQFVRAVSAPPDSTLQQFPDLSGPPAAPLSAGHPESMESSTAPSTATPLTSTEGALLLSADATLAIDEETAAGIATTASAATPQDPHESALPESTEVCDTAFAGSSKKEQDEEW